MLLFALGFIALGSPFSSAVPFGNPDTHLTEEPRVRFECKLQMEHKGSTAPLRGCWREATAGTGTSPRRGRGRVGEGVGRDPEGGQNRLLGSVASLTKSSSSWEKVLCHGLDSGCFLQKSCVTSSLINNLLGPVQSKYTEPLAQKLLRISRSFCCGSAEMNLTSIPEDAGLIPGLAQWVKDPALPRAVV